jgi:hypothetical protein
VDQVWEAWSPGGKNNYTFLAKKFSLWFDRGNSLELIKNIFETKILLHIIATTCQQASNEQCEQNLILAFGNNPVASLLQDCRKLCVFTRVHTGGLHELLQ